jgi:hypothetical protein
VYDKGHIYIYIFNVKFVFSKLRNLNYLITVD